MFQDNSEVERLLNSALNGIPESSIKNHILSLKDRIKKYQQETGYTGNPLDLVKDHIAEIKFAHSNKAKTLDNFLSRIKPILRPIPTEDEACEPCYGLYKRTHLVYTYFNYNICDLNILRELGIADPSFDYLWQIAVGSINNYIKSLHDILEIITDHGTHLCVSNPDPTFESGSCLFSSFFFEELLCWLEIDQVVCWLPGNNTLIIDYKYSSTRQQMVDELFQSSAIPISPRPFLWVRDGLVPYEEISKIH